MRKHAMALVMLAMLQGCASNAPRTDANADLSSLRLFRGAQPRFTVELACGGAGIQETRQCLTVSNEFYAWANTRHVRLHLGTLDRTTHEAPASGATATPYRIVVRFQPYFQATILAGTAGNYIPGEVGYKADIEVFDASTGSTLRTLPLQKRQVVPDRSNISEFIRADAAAVIAKIDPAYSP